MTMISRVIVLDASESPGHANDGWKSVCNIKTSDGKERCVWEKIETDNRLDAVAMAYGVAMYPSMFPIKSRAYLSSPEWTVCQREAKAFLAMHDILDAYKDAQRKK